MGHLGALSEKVNFVSEIFARRCLRNEHLKQPHDMRRAPAKQHGMWREIFKLKAEDKATLHSPEKINALVLVSKTTEERMFVVDWRASMHVLSKKYLSSDEMDTLRRSRTPAIVVTANGEVQTIGRRNCMFKISICSSQCNYETPAVLSLGKLCSEH